MSHSLVEPDPPPNGGHAAAFVLVGTLQRLGVSGFVVSPGSRSTPLVLAIFQMADSAAEIVLDERSAGFRAMGMAKVTGKPAVLVCTSGTAAANYLPAVVEATQSGVPLVILTADRPAELQSCGAPQTINQNQIYGTYPVFQATLPVPDGWIPDGDFGLRMRAVREMGKAAYTRAMRLGGCSHLNCPFREPFFGGKPLDLQGFLPEESEIRAIASNPDGLKLPEGWGCGHRILILAGAEGVHLEESQRDAWINLARACRIPILADGVSSFRCADGAQDVVISDYEWILRSDRIEDLRPTNLILIERVPTSKTLNSWLTGLDCPGLHIPASPAPYNPIFGRLQRWPGGASSLRNELSKIPLEKAYLSAWQREQQGVQKAVAKELELSNPPFEGEFLWELAHLDSSQRRPLFIANSLAIRDWEWFSGSGWGAWQPYSMRGANGIDGTLSVAAGIAKASGTGAVVVCGDLACLHDCGGMAGISEAEAGLCLIVFNNQGGGIFGMLPIAEKEPEFFEKYFKTPQRTSLGGLVKAFGGDYFICRDRDVFKSLVGDWGGKGLRMIEIPIDTHRSVERRRKLLYLPYHE